MDVKKIKKIKKISKYKKANKIHGEKRITDLTIIIIILGGPLKEEERKRCNKIERAMNFNGRHQHYERLVLTDRLRLDSVNFKMGKKKKQCFNT